MLRLITVVAALSVASSAFAQSAPHQNKTHKPAPAAAEKPTAVDDIAAVPRNVQKWMGGAVDDILTGAGQPLKP